ncbi:MAG: class B sortase [Defluviitaleaceae bacterium]|nr:class B sortase [Defluviitaleaceae bacterium]
MRGFIMGQKAKSNKIKLRIMIAVLVLSVGGAITFGVLLLYDMTTTRQGQDFFADMAIPVIQRPASLSRQSLDSENVNFTLMVDFDEKREQAPNIVGWIQSPGTVINYPVLHTTDNDFYLNHLPDGRRNAMGSIFLDYRNAADFSSQNMLIYGHNMASGDKFSSLRHYENQSFFEEHSTIFIFTPHKNFAIELFAGYNFNSNIEHPPMHFANETEFENYIEELRTRSFINSDLQVSFGDQLVFLATCVYAGDSPWRSVIVGRLVALNW